LQCIVRQPRPSPFPSITFLYNERSKYQQHMMEWAKEDFAGCDRCFSVDNENYGCDACVWLNPVIPGVLKTNEIPEEAPYENNEGVFLGTYSKKTFLKGTNFRIECKDLEPNLRGSTLLEGPEGGTPKKISHFVCPKSYPIHDSLI
jgi:hypothetical protein